MLFPRQTGALGKVTPRSDENACRRSRNSFSYSQKTVKLRKKYFLPKDISLRARRSHLAGAALSTSPDCSILQWQWQQWLLHSRFLTPAPHSVSRLSFTTSRVVVLILIHFISGHKKTSLLSHITFTGSLEVSFDLE